jgi:hypothetical protein
MYNNSFYITAHCNVNNLIEPYTTAPIGTWIHFAMSTEAGGTKMYLDGELVASNSTYIINTNVAGKALAIGVDVSPSGTAPHTDVNIGYFAGAIDDVRIYNTALSADDIRLIAAVPEAPAFALWGLGLGVVALTFHRRCPPVTRVGS